jgi:nucleoside-diphosphate-sugar epimerase
MVIGNGMVARRFNEYANDDRFLIFASGVSNSKTTDVGAYNREKQLLEQAIMSNPGKIIVYFSTCSIYDPSENNSIYVRHKQALENYIITSGVDYYIFRTANLVGPSGNPSNIFTFFLNSIKHNIPFKVWANATRNLIDVDDFYDIVHSILNSNIYLNSIVNIANPRSYAVPYIVESMESFLGKKALYDTIDKGAGFDIDTTQIQPVIEKLNISFDDAYLCQLLRKYHEL